MTTEAVIFQQIVDVNWDQAIYTASPNNTINVAQFAAKGSGANIAVAITPKGTGYISAHVADSAIAGGNARGTNAVDLQTKRGAASHVASGANSVIGGGESNIASGAHATVAGGNLVTASGQWSTAAGGRNNTASGQLSTVLGGQFCTASGLASLAGGNSATATGAGGVSIGTVTAASGPTSLATGNRGQSYLQDMRAHGSYALAADGACQEIALPFGGKTTTNAEVVLAIASGVRPVLASNRVWSGILHLVGCKSDGSAMAVYHRQLAIKRSGNTTTLEKNEVVGVDTASGTSINITADDTNEALSVGVTGVVSETWRWVAVFHGAELAIGA